MAKNIGIGKLGVAIAMALAFVMCLLSFLLPSDRVISGNFGICLPSPDLWAINPFLSWIINIGLIAIVTGGIAFLNHSFNFIRTTEPALPILFLIMTCANPWITSELSASILLVAVNVLSLSFMFKSYASRNATQDMFAVATFIGIGSMFQYSFIPFIIAYLIMAIVMKVMRIKEFLAFIIGLTAPYWVGIGLGLVPLSSFHCPEIVNLFGIYENPIEIILLLVSTGTAIFLGIMTGLTESMKLYAGNSKVNDMNFCVSILGIVCIISIIVDFHNILSYLATLYFTVAVQLANLCALWNLSHRWLVTVIPSFIFIAFFVAMIII